ncbi:MAG: GNAT family N-acetyltransferase [Syntrophobacteraceae bacterium]
MMQTALNGSYPSQYESRLTLKNGSEVFLRPIMRTDGHFLVDLFNKMTPQSIYLRFLWRLPALPEEMIRRFTHMDYKSEFALVALIEEQGKNAIIAVARYAFDRDEKKTDLAVAVRDDWQGLGLGKPMLAKIVAIGREHGIFRFQSMMDPENIAMKQILSGLGYEVQYSLRSGFLQVEIVA